MKVKTVFSDFDGTLTFRDELTKEFFNIIDLLKGHGVPLIVCTGRSKSWAHFLLTHFHDLQFVISEGGGNLSFIEERDGRRLLKDKLLVEKSEVDRLENLTNILLEKYPQIVLSADSFGREADRAIELYDLGVDPKLKSNIVQFFKEHKVNYSTSNVHMNFWCGEISKMKAINMFLSAYDLGDLEDSLFFGDSLNDESVFEGHPHSVGVSNISKVLNRLNFKPTKILEGEENEGPQGVLSYLENLLK